eukprot:TRINITY_DN601_c1_g1_i1.p1 TRINITY_DN601_c1_g1~~TRINITY_DN601_c1_g1_i1.p1  ORF type:complete len:1114 (-),score=340.65 TRINITY_DN601_c1_g1_i1:96-3416(-)
MAGKEHNVGFDTDLYSRQLYTFGVHAMQKLTSANVFLSGLGGLGVEVAKDLTLAGVKTLTLHDPFNAHLLDLSTQFFLTEENVNKGDNRAQISAQKIAELNPYVRVETYSKDDHLFVNDNDKFFNEFFTYLQSSNFQAVVLTGFLFTLPQIFKISHHCHKSDIKFVYGFSAGVFGGIFADFGDQHIITDKNGELPLEFYIENIAPSGEVSTLDAVKHNLEDGDVVTFTEVRGIDSINQPSVSFKVKTINASKFSLDNFSEAQHPGKYLGGGLVKQIKTNSTLPFSDFESSLSNAKFEFSDFAKFDRPQLLHAALLAAFEYIAQSRANKFQNKNVCFYDSLPEAWNAEDAEAFVKQCESVNTKYKLNVEVTKEARDLWRSVASVIKGGVVGVAGFLGGVLTQEVIKGITGKYTPLCQWLYFDITELLPNALGTVSGSNNVTLSKTRGAGQEIVVGTEVAQILSGLKIFMIGSGAIGCEMLKNFALMGLGEGKNNGKVVVTDMDLIEKSNLNRQFLFRSGDIQKPKSVTAAAAVQHMNSAITVEAQQNKVGTETEKIYTDAFWKAQDVIVGALDNVQARLYVDSRCVSFKKPLLESGTEATKGHVQVILPFATETYGSTKDPETGGYASCTIKTFPNRIEHTIQWARDQFESLYNVQVSEVDKMLEAGPQWIENFEGSVQGADRLRNSKRLVKIISRRPKTLEDCVKFGRLKFEANYHNKIVQLLHLFPRDKVHTTGPEKGKKYWSKEKRPPTPIVYDEKNPSHVNFVRFSALLFGRIWDMDLLSLYGNQFFDDEFVNKEVRKVKIETFVPADNKFIETDTNVSDEEMKKKKAEMEAKFRSNEEEEKKQIEQNLVVLKQFIDQNYSDFKTKKFVRIEEFEKDDDKNGHVDWILHASNIRAQNYEIKPADKLETKRIAGRIIPAIATTTAAVSGLASIELIKTAKILKSKLFNSDFTPDATLELFKNCFLNLGVPTFQFATPVKVKKNELAPGVVVSLWDVWDVKEGDLTVAQFLNVIDKKFKVSNVDAITQGTQMVYMKWMPGHDKRLGQKMRRYLSVEKEAKHVDLLITSEIKDVATGKDVMKGVPVRYWIVRSRGAAGGPLPTLSH